MDKIRVLLVDDEPLLLESLEIILTMNGMEVAGMARDGAEALDLMCGSSCDIALVDLNMKGMGGIELISHMKKQYPDVKILVLTTFYDDKSITQAIAGGADGYLLKDSGKDAILGAMEQVMGGRNVVDGKVMKRLAALMNGRISRVNAENTGDTQDTNSGSGIGSSSIGNSSMGSFGIGSVGTGSLSIPKKADKLVLPEEITEREKEICSLLARGLTNRQIAEALYISEGTVKNYISSIYDKTGIHDRARLVAEMNRFGSGENGTEW